MPRKKTHEEFLAEMAVRHPDIEVLGQYVNAHTKVKCRHVKEECGFEFEMRPNNLMNGQGCPKCGGTMKRTHEWFVEEVAKANDTIEIIGKYESRHKPVGARCRQCGHEWMPVASSLLGGHGCPICRNANGTSFMEELILDAFREALGKENVLSRNRELIGVELDIVIPSLKVAMEPGGWVWHKDKIEEDLAKREACREIGYRLISIYDSCRDKPPFEEDCYVFDFDLGAEPKNVSLRRLIIEIGGQYRLDLDFDEEIWKRLSRTAIRRARRKTTEEFVAEVAEINPSVEVLGEYTNSKKKVSCRCRECGNDFEMRPNSLLTGQGCPKCGDKRGAEKRRKTTEQFAEELAKVNPNIRVIGKYKGDAEKIKCECLVEGCGKVWMGIPSNLRQGVGCPKCKARKASLTHEEFVERVRQNNPEMEVLGQYTKSKNKVLVRHRTCGHEWTPIASNIMNGGGCPKCGLEKNGKAHRKTHERFIEELGEKNKHFANGEFEVVGKYVDGKTPIECRCPKHGSWKVLPRIISHGTGCPKCASLAGMSPDLAEQWHPKRNGDLTPWDVKPSSKIYVWWQCDKGHEWQQRLDGRYYGSHECPQCRRNKRRN